MNGMDGRSLPLRGYYSSKAEEQKQNQWNSVEWFCVVWAAPQRMAAGPFHPFFKKNGIHGLLVMGAAAPAAKQTTLFFLIDKESSICLLSLNWLNKFDWFVSLDCFSHNQITRKAEQSEAWRGNESKPIKQKIKQSAIQEIKDLLMEEAALSTESNLIFILMKLKWVSERRLN